MRVILTIDSSNRKTGRIPVSMTERASCPTSCRLYSTCYARGGNLGITWLQLSRGDRPGVDWATFCNQIRSLGPKIQIWRHDQAGDLPGRDNRLDLGACLDLADANCADNRNRGGFTYTHYSPLPGSGVDLDTAKHNGHVIHTMVARGFSVNLSGDTLEHADQLYDLGIAPVVTVLPRDQIKGTETPKGRRVLVCPAVTRDGMTCRLCKLCRKTERKAIIGFPAHGFAIAKMDHLTRGAGRF